MTRMKYACGHELEGIGDLARIVYHDMSPFTHWVKTVGFQGDKSMCWNCFVDKVKGDLLDEK